MVNDMKFNKITAIIQPAKLEIVEEELKKLCVPGISITKVHGHGEAPNFFTPDWTSAFARIEIYIESNKTEEGTQVIMNAASTGKEGDGIVAVLPVESLYQIRTKNQVDIE